MSWNFFKRKNINEKDLKCPRCRVNMRKVEKHDVVIDYCEKCKGMWLDDKEIDKLIEIGKKKSIKNRKK